MNQHKKINKLKNKVIFLNTLNMLNNKLCNKTQNSIQNY